MRQILINTSDNYTLTTHIFEAKKSNNRLIIINSATGVKQQVYFAFSRFFANNGYTVITYDYRGIGLSKPKSLKGFNANMRVWGSIDFKAITQFVIKNFPNYHTICLGHSVGALILGMNADSKLIQEFVFVGTQNAYLGNLNFKTRIEGLFGFGLVQPISTKIFGYFPANWFGLGESLPAGCANDWNTLILSKKSTNQLLDKIENFSNELTQKVLVVRAEDDVWLTEKGVKSLMNETYVNMKPKYRLVKKDESPKNEIGHINFFRSYNQPLWDIILKELNK